MTIQKYPRRPAARVCASIQIDAEKLAAIDDHAHALGWTRHRLMLKALEVGVPIAAAQAGYQAATEPTAKA